jgi:long-chain acyl-CoA synthetase
MLSHRNLVTNAAGKLYAMPQSSTDIRLNFLPFSHSYARTCELSTWLLTGGQFILARQMKHVVSLAQTYRPTLINGVPLFFDQLRVQHGPCNKHQALVDFLGGSIRQLASGGAALNVDTATYFEAAQLPVLVGYGLTEASPVVCSNLSSDGRTDNVGPPIPGVSLRVDASGELWVSGSGVMKGYFGNPVATAEAIVNGELRTGDLAEIDSRGRVRLVGRVRDTLILSSGVKVAPYQVEKQLKLIAGTEDAVVLGDGWERCAAVVVLSRDLWRQFSHFSRAEQFEFLGKYQKGLDTLPKYAVPAAWVFRANSFASNPTLVNFKGTPRRDMIRLQYADVLRESIRSGAISIYLDPRA